MISDAIVDKVYAELTTAFISDLEEDDPTRAGLILQGPYQGQEDLERARIIIEIYENDPDKFQRGAVTSMWGAWEDEVAELEIGGSVIWNRRYTVKARALMTKTKEDINAARLIASTLKDRLTRTLITIDFAGTQDDEEFVSRGILSHKIQAEAIQGGGPQAYDYYIKVRFEVQTTLNL